MSRLSDAWAALCGRPRVVEVEKEVRVNVPVIGDAHTVSLYAHVKYTPPPPHLGIWARGGYEMTYYTTCEQAHKAHPGSGIKRMDAICIGGKYFIAEELKPVEVAPKPKRAKGAKA